MISGASNSGKRACVRAGHHQANINSAARRGWSVRKASVAPMNYIAGAPQNQMITAGLAPSRPAHGISRCPGRRAWPEPGGDDGQNGLRR